MNTKASKPPARPERPVLAMVYVLDQKWRAIYSARYGFQRGTIFEELDKPWLVRGERRE